MFYFVLGYSQLTMLWFQVKREGAFLFPHLSHLLSIKETGIQIQWDGYFETLVCHSLGQLALRIKSYSMLQHLSSHSLVCWVASRASLDLVTVNQSVQSLSRVWLFVTPWTAACQASLSITNSRSLLKLMSIESVRPSNQLILCHPLLLPPSIFPNIRVFSNESLLRIRWPKYWSFNFSISLSNEHLGLISFRMDWLDLLAVQGTLKSSPQFKSINFWHSAFFMGQRLKRIFLWGKLTSR